MELNGKTALITGGGTGIGAATAWALAKHGCRVAIAGRRTEKLEETASRYNGDAPVAFHSVDVGNRDSVAELFEWAKNELGPLDILVNSAGVNVPKRSMSELTPDDWDFVVRINATGTYNCIRAVLPQMRERGGGLIVNISSVAGKRAGPIGGVAYNASKFAMSALGTSVAEEERGNGIRVSNIYPGEVETPILDERPVPVSAEHRARILQPEDVASAVLMVACLPARANIPELVISPTTQSYR